MLSHRNLVANMVQCQALFALSPGDVVIAALPFFHQAGLAGVMNTGRRAGATIITMPRFEPGQFLDLLERYAVTRGHVVPPMALALARHPSLAGRDLSALRHITCGAAPLGAELEAELARRMGCAVSQVYGLTEASLITHLAPPFGRAGKRGSVGPPVPGTECRLADPQTGAEAGPGERGDVRVRGPQVMRGYLNNPEATAAVIDGEGWLHTGDLGIADQDGWLTIVDRVKELIKYKGLQVAPAELEAILMTHPQGRRLRGDRRPRPGGRGSAEGVRGPGGRRLRRQGGPRLRRRAGSAVQAHPAHRARAGDPQVAIGEGPQAPAPLS
jgi:acyl-CoA synthetase (AMP-forming)/AMP-acid ligase II